MEKQKKALVDWVNEHQKELAIASVSITAIIAVIIGIKNHKTIEGIWTSLSKLIDNAPETISISKPALVKEIEKVNTSSTKRMPHYVAEHTRNLPDGCKASAQKIATAAEHGYDLPHGKTWVEGYRTGEMAV